MRPTDGEGPFDDPRYFFEPWWPGIRALVLVEGGGVRLRAEALADPTPVFPELAGVAGLVRGGRRRARRDAHGPRRARPALAGPCSSGGSRGGAGGTAALVAADLLYLDGTSLAEPAVRRAARRARGPPRAVALVPGRPRLRRRRHDRGGGARRPRLPGPLGAAARRPAAPRARRRRLVPRAGRRRAARAAPAARGPPPPAAVGARDDGMPLERYRAKRDFGRTPEPAPGPEAAPGAGGPRPGRGARPGGRPGRLRPLRRPSPPRQPPPLRPPPRDRRRPRLAGRCPRARPAIPDERRFAARTEDHPIEYLDFEGVIPKGEYGAGDSICWDWGTFEPELTWDPGAAVAGRRAEAPPPRREARRALHARAHGRPRRRAPDGRGSGARRRRAAASGRRRHGRAGRGRGAGSSSRRPGPRRSRAGTPRTTPPR